MAFASCLAILTQVEVTGQEHIAGTSAYELKGIKLEGVGLTGSLGNHWGECLVLAEASVDMVIDYDYTIVQV